MYIPPLSQTPHDIYTVTVKTITTISNLHLKCHHVNPFVAFVFLSIQEDHVWLKITPLEHCQDGCRVDRIYYKDFG